MKPYIAFLLLCNSLFCYATEKELGGLETYRPNFVGVTFDDNDVPFLEFKVSLKYPVFHSGESQSAAFGFLPRGYFAFSGRFAQYIGTRDSSPVMGKSFNPEVFGRYWLSDSKSTIDIVYGHESNGQSITDPLTYQAQRVGLVLKGENPDYANDYISRGWDYIAVSWGKNWLTKKSHRQLHTFVNVRTFLSDGLLQGEKEEYNAWENDAEGKPRSYTDGIEFAARFNTEFDAKIFRGNKLYISYTTGIEKPVKYNSYRAELSIGIGNIPITLWGNYGYNSDFTDYFRKVKSLGLGVEFLSLN
ncbi:MAG: hypothetical protein HRU20_18215 [Pseudomonadales bacterium]|nr:hypothetical protein [Pseudomonadales bacterium]